LEHTPPISAWIRSSDLNVHMGNLLVRSVSGCLPFVGQGVEVDLQPVGFGDSWPIADGPLWGAWAVKADVNQSGNA
jgi:hypothetical protein